MGKYSGKAIASICLLAATFVVTALFMCGIWGASPSDESSLTGHHVVRTESGVNILELTVQDGGEATIDYRGVQLKGTLKRYLTTQRSTTYRLTEIEECSAGDAKNVSFTLECPVDGLQGSPVGLWSLRFHNGSVEQGSNVAAATMFLGMNDPEVHEARYEEAGEQPFELYDWFELADGGSGLELNEQFIPTADVDTLRGYARSVSWMADGDALVLKG